MAALRELTAIALLVLRSWQRMGPRTRTGRAPEPTRGVSAVLMRLVFAALIYNFGSLSAQAIALHEHPEWAATWAGLGFCCFAFSIAFSVEVPAPRAPTSALKSALLELLPVSRSALLLLLLAQAIWGALPLLACALTVRAALGTGAPLPMTIVLGLLLFALSALGGACLGKLLKLRLSPYLAARTGWLSTVLVVGSLSLVETATVARHLKPPFGLALGRALVWPSAAFLGELALLVGLACLAFYRLERRHELAEPIRPDKTASELRGGADPRALERLLTRREPGGRWQIWIVTALHLVYVCGALYAARALSARSRGEFSGKVGLNLAVIICFQLVTTLAAQRSARGAMRDALARPLLGALPLAPQNTLSAKVGTLRWMLLLVTSPLCLLLGLAHFEPALWPLLLWRIAAIFAATAVYAGAAVYVAFLTVGLGSTRPRAGVFGSLESLLLAIPFASIAFAPTPWSAALALATLVALTFEARRSALRVVDWLDDPEREHATEIWRALVVFAGFQGAQILALQLTSLFGHALSNTMRFVAVYALAAAALWFPTQREQTSSIPEQRIRFAPLGLPVGALSGGFAWLYLRFLHPSTAAGPELSVATAGESALLAITVACIAPLVEERFFRGWLQAELERSLSPRRNWAPVLTALAFALAHPVYSFVPVFVFGLLSGFLMLRTRSLAACVVAHAVH
ncbi:MAG TPA: CPBP family intramembrane glutamic endopeptidase, partial [Polyangiaceae bacterium]